ncbi:UDP-N-acetylmuramate dehydrogenase [Dokdonia sinensis]|uniref:UDP-N-acetylenolpyruvoylglucosamine reductase n=1 Tax=Dokdonia sinensis TaxID=2479847 RepID=A0A3M0GGT9_9FLAO|nr:UDP-N-acetylmuramate dehydrogenase [Dokdonia sinensis]RMB63890.1 UDP-N-acetylmuramate dehydrogenase [Dokdonia sinensis]
MNIKEHVSLREYNTFGIDVIARYLVSVHTVSELKKVLGHKEYKNPFIISGGSNMLLTKDIDRLVIHLDFKGMEIVDDSFSEDEVLLRVAGGENWHEFVLYCVSNNLGGVENLSLIPGNVGTSPIQNIGAYGVELKDVFHSCTAIHRESFEEATFYLEDCAFGYRDSVFKNTLKDKYIITSVTFRLTKKNHILHTEYGAIYDTLVDRGIDVPTIKDVSDAVITIRKSKLPDPRKIGNSGSFFKNPIISQKVFTRLRKKFPTVPFYPVAQDTVKVPAGWLIEQAGFKGKRFGDAGVHDKQALVLVNHGNATGEEIWNLAIHIQKTVEDKFGLHIEPEVNVI